MSSSQVEEIKSRLDVADIVSSYLKLDKAGVNFKARCPFHNEKTPSFFVTPSRQIWHCFGCQKGGDIFQFVMDMEGCEFPEALAMLAERAGVELRPQAHGERNARARLFELVGDAAKFFENMLQRTALSEISSEAVRSPLQYLKSRGLTDKTIREFRVGYAPDEWQALFLHLSAKGFRSDEIEKAGLAIRGQSATGQRERYYDRFRGRIIFPIFDHAGRVVAFGGRIFEAPTVVGAPNKVGAKYINSPETPLYYKSKILYGFHAAKKAILAQQECVVTEGYMDMLMAYQAGTHHVVASSGTALTADQLRVVRRLCEKLLVAFDMDVAGQEATRRGIAEALAQGFSVRVLGFPEGLKDPSDVVARDHALWQKALQDSRHIVQFYIDSACARHSRGSPELSRSFDHTVIPVIASLNSELEQAHWIAEVARLLGIKEEAVWSALAKTQNTEAQNTNKTQITETLKTRTQTRKELLENRVLGMMAKTPELLKNTHGIAPELFSQKKQTIFSDLASGKEGKFPFKDFISRLVLEADLFLEGVADAESEFIKCATELKKEHLRERMQDLTQKITAAEKNNTSTEIPTLIQEFRTISEKFSKL